MIIGIISSNKENHDWYYFNPRKTQFSWNNDHLHDVKFIDAMDFEIRDHRTETLSRPVIWHALAMKKHLIIPNTTGKLYRNKNQSIKWLMWHPCHLMDGFLRHHKTGKKTESFLIAQIRSFRWMIQYVTLNDVGFQYIIQTQKVFYPEFNDFPQTSYHIHSFHWSIPQRKP